MKTLFRLLRRLVVLVCIAAVLLTALPPLEIGRASCRERV